MKAFLLFILAIFISFIPGFIGMLFTPIGHSDAWFNALGQSAWTPAPWVFPMVWTVLYTLLGIALFMIINNNRARYSKKKSYWLFFIQMVLNALWSYVFFGLHKPGCAMIVVVALFLIAIWMMRAFLQISRVAGLLVLPYVIWLGMAMYLNYAILYLN